MLIFKMVYKIYFIKSVKIIICFTGQYIYEDNKIKHTSSYNSIKNFEEYVFN